MNRQVHLAWSTYEIERLRSETHKAVDACIRWRGLIGSPKSEGAEQVYLRYRDTAERMIDELANRAENTMIVNIPGIGTDAPVSLKALDSQFLFTQKQRKLINTYGEAFKAMREALRNLRIVPCKDADSEQDLCFESARETMPGMGWKIDREAARAALKLAEKVSK